ncbi:MAG TPA: DUF5985 family protein [Candidatus Angelobacter sp.]|nr:DUF5985 family protein [Candidatus Angelobacter sp.]
MSHFVSGMLTMGYIVAGIFFLRFWRDSRDRLFAMFGASFFILAVQRLGLEFSRNLPEEEPLWYFVRLAAFVIIVVAIVDKNRKK